MKNRIDNARLEALLVRSANGEDVDAELLGECFQPLAEMVYADNWRHLYFTEHELLKLEAVTHAWLKRSKWTPQRGTAFNFFIKTMKNKMLDVSRKMMRARDNQNAMLERVEQDPVVRRGLCSNAFCVPKSQHLKW